jgi:hypothetical protein
MELHQESDVAKKKADDMATPAARRASTARRSTKRALSTSVDLAGVTPAGPIDTAADMGGEVPGAAYLPNYDEIAHAAYLRYLSRGGGDGGDFDDWIAAERELARRHGA